MKKTFKSLPTNTLIQQYHCAIAAIDDDGIYTWHTLLRHDTILTEKIEPRPSICFIDDKLHVIIMIDGEPHIANYHSSIGDIRYSLLLEDIEDIKPHTVLHHKVSVDFRIKFIPIAIYSTYVI